jgi:hypothetical protein
MRAKLSFLKRSVAAALPAVVLAVSLGAQTPEWKTYSYPADGFSVSLPSQPNIQKQNVPTDAGTFELRTYVVDVAPSGMMVGVCDYGSELAGKEPDSVLQGAKNGALKNTNTRLVHERKISLGVNHGLEFEAENDTIHITVRVYVAGTTLYQVLVVYPVGKELQNGTEFLDSFQLIAQSGK